MAPVLSKLLATFAILLALHAAVSAQFAGPRLIPPSTEYPQDLTGTYLFDLDADGISDLITIKRNYITTNNTYYMVVDWQRNTGSGGFDAPQTVSTPDPNIFASISNFAAIDLDNNGFADLIYNGANGPFWQRNLGAGTFGAPESLPVAFSTWGDVDADGDIDLLGFDFWTGLFWLQNDGAGNFTNNPISNPSCCPKSIQLTDLTGDGLPDILYYDFIIDEVRWYPNIGGASSGHLF